MSYADDMIDSHIDWLLSAGPGSKAPKRKNVKRMKTKWFPIKDFDANEWEDGDQFLLAIRGNEFGEYILILAYASIDEEGLFFFDETAMIERDMILRIDYWSPVSLP